MSLSRRQVLGSLGCATALSLMSSAAPAASFFRIMTGAPSGTYYPIGTAIAGVIGAPEGGRPCRLGGGCGVEGLVALVQSSKGSVENVETIESAEVESGFCQADIAFFAANAQGPFEGRPPYQKLRGICSLFDEALHLVVTPSSGISAIRDLRGTRVAIGSPGSGTASTVRRLLDAFGLGSGDLTLVEIDAVEALGRMRVGSLEAMFIIAGAPVEVVSEAISSLDAQLVSIDGGPIDRLLKDNPFLTRANIQAGTYAGAYGSPTIAVRALWLVSADVADELVYGITQAFWHPQSQAFLRNVHPRLIDLNLAHALDGMEVPVHPGAAEFYREQGFVQ
jgi:TRAP transporter TAXI family solute receptor